MAKDVTYIISLRDLFSGKLSTIHSKIKILDAQFGGLASTIGIAFSDAMIAGGIMKAVNAWDKQVQAITQVRQALMTTGNTAGKTLEELIKASKTFQSKTIFGDEDILQGVTSQLLAFTNISGSNFDRLQKVILDVTTRLDGSGASVESLKGKSLLLGKALNDPIGQLGVLSKSGRNFLLTFL